MKEVTITGKPVEILPLQDFQVTIIRTCHPDGTPFSQDSQIPVPDLYVSVELEGLLLRGLVN